MQGPSGRPPLAEEGSGTGSKPVNEGLEELRRRIVPADSSGRQALIFVDDGRPLAADFFGSEDLALKLLPKLLRVLMSRAMPRGERGKRRRPARTAGRRSSSSSEYAAPAAKPAAQRARCRAAGRASGLLGGGVVLEDLVVHYGVRVEELGTSYRRPRPTIIWPRSEMHGERQ